MSTIHASAHHRPVQQLPVQQGPVGQLPVQQGPVGQRPPVTQGPPSGMPPALPGGLGGTHVPPRSLASHIARNAAIFGLGGAAVGALATMLPLPIIGAFAAPVGALVGGLVGAGIGTIKGIADHRRESGPAGVGYVPGQVPGRPPVSLYPPSGVPLPPPPHLR